MYIEFLTRPSLSHTRLPSSIGRSSDCPVDTDLLLLVFQFRFAQKPWLTHDALLLGLQRSVRSSRRCKCCNAKMRNRQNANVQSVRSLRDQSKFDGNDRPQPRGFRSSIQLLVFSSVKGRIPPSSVDDNPHLPPKPPYPGRHLLLPQEWPGGRPPIHLLPSSCREGCPASGSSAAFQTPLARLLCEKLTRL
jgi:hypothetical protein